MISLWTDELEFSVEFIRQNPVFVAHTDERVFGCTAISIDGEVAELEHMWVDSKEIGKGIGRALFRHACLEAHARGVRFIRIVSDPHAVGFYEHLGAIAVGEVESRPEGRKLPMLEMRVYDAIEDQLTRS